MMESMAKGQGKSEGISNIGMIIMSLRLEMTLRKCNLKDCHIQINALFFLN